MNDQQVMHAMLIDDMYHVERVLARRADSITELVTIEDTGPFIRKKIALSLVKRGVWAALATAAQACDRLPKMTAAYELPDQLAIVYEYVHGKTLEMLVDAEVRVSERKAVRLALDLCAASAALHKLGMIHRDIAPRNIIVAKDGAHLVDFGISRLHRQGVRKDTTSLGTWGFASSEQYGFA